MTLPKKRRDIEVGRAVLRWADELRPSRGGDILPAGWVLPGGRREPDYTKALEAARLMDGILRGELQAS